MKKTKGIFWGILCCLLLTGCGEDKLLDEYQTNMETFFEHVAEVNDNMNDIDISKQDYVAQLLGYLDDLDTEITWMADLEVPEQFSAVESLADEAAENMTQAVSLFHMAYEGEEYDENMQQAAKEYYDRANIRIQYILTILHGGIPEGDGVTYTEENKILGGGYMNKTDENDDSDIEDDDSVIDNFDTDDTVFYE